MNKKKIFFLSITMVIIFMWTLNISKVTFADDTTADTDHIDDGYNSEYADEGQWGVAGAYTGTRYSIVIDGVVYEYDLPAGTGVAGTDIKGYNSTGRSDLGIQDPNYQLSKGIIEIDREEFAALARSQGNEELARLIESGVPFTAFSEQYIEYTKGDGTGLQRNTATEMMQMLKEFYENGGDSSYGIGFIEQIIKASFISFTELDQSDPLYLYLLLLNKDPNSERGYGIYVFEKENPVEDPKPDPDPEPIPDDPKKPDPIPEPVETPRLKITPGDAGDSNQGTADGEIDNIKYGVKAGNPIPTSRDLTGKACTDIVGKVENLRRIHGIL